uniref:Protein sleepless n=1 Tax=Cacopsylla melanoneura TaxID=428564 RepID=A0A8D8PTZ6_9HEMI
MTTIIDKAILTLVLVALGFKGASSIDCYQCVSTDLDHPFQCNEYLSDDIDIAPQSCANVYGASYCVKHTGRFEGGIGTKRFCSSLNLGNYCNYISQPGDSLLYRSCVYTCDSDGCNGSDTLCFSIVTLLIALYFTLIRS